jgi:hypothetical protein
MHGKMVLSKRRRRTTERARAMRKVWATCAAAVFFLAECEAYFQGAIVQESFDHFLSWVNGAHDTLPTTSPQTDSQLWSAPEARGLYQEPITRQQHDPEALGLAHRHFLSSITYYLLLTDLTFPKLLRVFCTHVDEMVAYITRLTNIQQSLDLEEDEGVEDFSQNYKEEENDVLLELDRARRRLDSDLKGLVERLREIDSERIGTLAPSLVDTLLLGEARYEPLRVGGIDRLLMKLDWDGEDQEEEEEEEEEEEVEALI